MKLRKKLREKKIKYSGIWTKSERKIKELSENLRNKFFHPVVFILAKLKITPNIMSIISALTGIVATVYIWYDLKIAGILLIASLVLDGIDGPLARYTGTGSPRGEITDAFTDQTVISATTIGFIANGLIHPVIGGVYLAVYPLLVTFIILRNIINKPSLYVFRPRLFVYVSFLLYAFWGINWMNYIIIPATGIVGIYFLYNFFKLRRML
jgi:phosphatidylglycerophosphate synthase